jgi:hypothetical protein
VQTYQIHIPQARESLDEVRGSLFAFPEILDVVALGRRDTLVVVCAGRPRPAEWLRCLRAAGYHATTPRRHPHASLSAPAPAAPPDVLPAPRPLSAGTPDGDPPRSWAQPRRYARRPVMHAREPRAASASRAAD